MNKNKSWLGILCVSLACILWGSIGMGVKFLYNEGLTAMDTIEVRSITGAVVVGIYILIRDKSLFKIDLKHIWIFIGTGILNMMLNGFCYCYCLELTDMATTAAFNATGPMFALMFGCILFNEKLTAKKLGAIVCTFSGCLLLSGFTGGDKVPTLGVIMGLMGAVGYSMYSVFSRFAIQRNYNAITITFYSLVICAIGCACFTNWPVTIACATTKLSNWIWILLLGVGDGFLGYLLYTKGLEYIEIGTAAILSSLDLLTSAVLGILVFSEKLTGRVAGGILFILFGIFVSNYEFKKLKK